MFKDFQVFSAISLYASAPFLPCFREEQWSQEAALAIALVPLVTICHLGRLKISQYEPGVRRRRRNIILLRLLTATSLFRAALTVTCHMLSLLSCLIQTTSSSQKKNNMRRPFTPAMFTCSSWAAATTLAPLPWRSDLNVECKNSTWELTSNIGSIAYLDRLPGYAPHFNTRCKRAAANLLFWAPSWIESVHLRLKRQVDTCDHGGLCWNTKTCSVKWEGTGGAAAAALSSDRLQIRRHSCP